MKKYEILANTWHYRLAHDYAGFSEYNKNQQNICSYRWQVLWGACIVSMITAVLSCISLSFLYLGLATYAATTHHVSVDSITGLEILLAIIIIIIGIIAIVAGSIVYSVVGIIRLYKKYFPTTEIIDKSGFIVTAWKSYKEKTCIPIKIVHKSKQKKK